MLNRQVYRQMAQTPEPRIINMVTDIFDSRGIPIILQKQVNKTNDVSRFGQSSNYASVENEPHPLILTSSKYHSSRIGFFEATKRTRNRHNVPSRATGSDSDPHGSDGGNGRKLDEPKLHQNKSGDHDTVSNDFSIIKTVLRHFSQS